MYKRNIMIMGQGTLFDHCLWTLDNSRYHHGSRSKNCLNLDCIIMNEEVFKTSKHSHKKFISNSKRNEETILNWIKVYNMNTIISIQHLWILSPEVIDAVGGYAFNLHNAKLPNYKGHNVLAHEILNDEKTHTTTIHWIAPEVDMGDIAYERTIDIDPDETAQSLYKKSIYSSVLVMKSLIKDLGEGIEPPRKPIISEDGSSSSRGNFYKKGDIEGLRIVNSHEEENRKARAFYIPPYEPAYYEIDGIKHPLKPPEKVEEMKAALIISVHNKVDMLDNTFYALSLQKTSFPLEVCVIDDGSEVSPEPIIKKYLPDIKFKRFEKNIKFMDAHEECMNMVSDDVNTIMVMSSDMILIEDDAIEKLCKGVGERIFTIGEVYTKKIEPDMYKNWEKSSKELNIWKENCSPYHHVFCGSKKPTRWYIFAGAFRRVDIELIDFFGGCDIIQLSNLSNTPGFKVNIPMVTCIHQEHGSHTWPCGYENTCVFGCTRR